MNSTLKLLRLIPVMALLLIFSCEMEENEIKDLEEQVSTDVLVMDYNARRPTIDPTPGRLIAGQTMDVGSVDVQVSGNSVYITYTTNSDWCLSEVHADIALTPDEIPQGKKGNPQIGNFDYVMEFDDCFSSYTVELTKPDDNCFYIAAHAVVKEVIGYETDVDPIDLPDQVTMQVSYPSPGDPSYFETTVTGGTLLDGIFNGWCIDTDNTIAQNNSYTANVYSSYADLPAGTVEHPENLDLVNWIINQDFVGQNSVCSGAFTYGDVQRAIWTLIEDNNSTSGLGSWNQCRVNEILEAAQTAGTDFTPECGEQIAIILFPVGANDNPGAQITIAQITLIEKEIFCTPVVGEGEETAWGSGTQFNEKGSWAMYSDYCDYGL